MGKIKRPGTEEHLRGDLTLRILKISDVILVTLPFGLAWMFYYAERTYSPYYNKGNWLIIAIFSVLFIAFGRIYEGFLINVRRMSEILYSQGLAIFFSDAIMYVITLLLTKHLPSVLPLCLVFAAQVSLALGWTCLAHRWYFRHFAPKRTVVVYDVREGIEELVIKYRMDRHFHIEQVVGVDECLAGDMEMLEDAEAVFLWGIHSHERNIILKWCLFRKPTVYILPRIGDILMSSAKRMHMFHLPVLRTRRYIPEPEYAAIKRAFDIVSSLIVLVILSPVMLLTAIAIKAEDGGPVFYRQKRLTKDGKPFYIIKFRSMRVDAEKDGKARLSSGTKDTRITSVGKFIRMVRIDEIPQLINIIKGEMSVVGPRPERPEIMEEYEKELPEFALRLQVKAGLTGYAQVYGKYNTTPYDKLQMDLMYIARASILEDITIILATIKILLLPESTEGVGEGQSTAMERRGAARENRRERMDGLAYMEPYGNIAELNRRTPGRGGVQEKGS